MPYPLSSWAEGNFPKEADVGTVTQNHCLLRTSGSFLDYKNNFSLFWNLIVFIWDTELLLAHSHRCSEANFDSRAGGKNVLDGPLTRICAWEIGLPSLVRLWELSRQVMGKCPYYLNLSVRWWGVRQLCDMWVSIWRALRLALESRKERAPVADEALPCPSNRPRLQIWAHHTISLGLYLLWL